MLYSFSNFVSSQLIFISYIKYAYNTNNFYYVQVSSCTSSKTDGDNKNICILPTQVLILLLFLNSNSKQFNLYRTTQVLSILYNYKVNRKEYYGILKALIEFNESQLSYIRITYMT